MNAAPPPLVSVIIPTYRRPDALAVALAALAKQTYPPARFEVIAVDDGSGDQVPSPDGTGLPFAFAYLRQPHRGATAARNIGAAQSHGAVLVFMDDDIEPAPDALCALVEELACHSHVIALATLSTCPPHPGETPAPGTAVDDAAVPVPFAECRTGLLGARREDFTSLGGFKDPTGGWPNWDDVDFGYRAHLAGYQIMRCTRARAVHHDAAATLAGASDRWYRAAHAAARLLQRHPELLAYLPMIHDKTPIAWRADPPRLIVRKLARHVTSSWLALGTLEGAATLLARWRPHGSTRRALERWVVGGYLCRGYRQGLYELGAAVSRRSGIAAPRRQR